MSFSPTDPRRTVIVGLFVAIGLLILAGGILAVGSVDDLFRRKIEVRTVFSEVAGLKTGDAVWSSGLKVGTVDGLRFVGPAQVEVELLIDAEIATYIPSDAVAKLGSDGLIGNAIVVLTGGTPDARPVSDGDLVASVQGVSTEELLTVLQENNVNLRSITEDLKGITAGIAAGEGSLGRLLKDDTLYGDISSAVASLDAAAANARQLTGSLSAFTDKLDDEGTLLHELVTDKELFPSISASVQRLEGAATQAESLVATVQQGMSNPDTPVGALLGDAEMGADLKTTLANLQTATVLLNEDLKALQSNFLLRPYFKKQEREARKAEREAARQGGARN